MQLFAHFYPNPAVWCGRELGKKQGKPMGWCQDILIGQEMKEIRIIKECKARGSCSLPADQCPASSWAAVSPSTLVDCPTLLFQMNLHGMGHPLAGLDQLSWPCHLLVSLAPSVSITVRAVWKAETSLALCSAAQQQPKHQCYQQFSSYIESTAL